jgi:hypothetical protein
MTDTYVEEIQTCPRRIGGFGPWPHEERLDRWERNRWKATKEDADAEIAEFKRRNPQGAMGDPQWYGPPEQQPRTCSFCGGIHPDDAIELIRLGWEVESTDKGYKHYLNPGGTRMRHAVLMNRLRENAEKPFAGVPSVWSPLPPVKIYMQHFSEDQVARANAALAEAKAGRTG